MRHMAVRIGWCPPFGAGPPSALVCGGCSPFPEFERVKARRSGPAAKISGRTATARRDKEVLPALAGQLAVSNWTIGPVQSDRTDTRNLEDRAQSVYEPVLRAVPGRRDEGGSKCVRRQGSGVKKPRLVFAAGRRTPDRSPAAFARTTAQRPIVPLPTDGVHSRSNRFRMAGRESKW